MLFGYLLSQNLAIQHLSPFFTVILTTFTELVRIRDMIHIAAMHTRIINPRLYLFDWLILFGKKL